MPSKKFSKKHIPKKFQLKAVRKMNHFDGRVLLADEMGLGKTLETLLWMEQAGKSIYPAVVVCPAGAKWVWEQEAADQIGVRGIVLEGQKPSNQPLIKIPKLVIINYEILQYWKKWLKKLKPQTIAIDEAHYIKNYSKGKGKTRVKRTQACKTLAKGVPNIIGISGTPLTNRPEELWNIINLIRPDVFSSRMEYLHRYCKPTLTPWGWQFKGATNLKELHRKLSSTMMIRRRKKDVLKELPPKQRHIIPLDISTKHRREYEQARNNFLNWLAKKSKSKAQKASKAERLVQIGYLRRLAAMAKLNQVIKWIEDFFEENDGKLIVFGIHKPIINALKEKFKNICVAIDGSVAMKKRKAIVHGFQTNKRIRLFIGQIKAAGEIITLTAAETVAMAELDRVPSNHTQAEDRAHRMSQYGNVQIYYLVAKRTYEEELCKVIQTKQEIISKVLDGKKQEDDLDIWSEFQRLILKG